MIQSKSALRSLSVVCMLVLAIPSILLCQLNGSGYSRYGIGDLQYFQNGRSAGMGGAGTASLMTSSIDQINPADWARISLTRFSLSGNYVSLSTTDAASSAHYGNFGFNGMMFALPIMPQHGVVIGFGLTPYSSVGYTIVTPQSQAGYDYNVQFHGEGGLSKGQVGFSANLGAAVNFGLAYNYYFGSIQHNVSQTFSSGTFSNSTAVRQIQLKGSGMTLGLVYAGLGNLITLPENAELHIGGFLSTTSYLTADEERRTTSTQGTVNTYDTISTAQYSMKLPLRMGLGIAYTGDRLQLAGDFVMQNWDESSFPGTLIATVRNSYRWSIGGEMGPKHEQNLPFLQKLTYRVGAYYLATYFMVKDQPINETGITAGFAIPILADTRIDIAGEYGMRGTTDAGLQKDKIFRFTFTLTGSEAWFTRPPEE